MHHIFEQILAFDKHKHRNIGYCSFFLPFLHYKLTAEFDSLSHCCRQKISTAAKSHPGYTQSDKIVTVDSGQLTKFYYYFFSFIGLLKHSKKKRKSYCTHTEINFVPCSQIKMIQIYFLDFISISN